MEHSHYSIDSPEQLADLARDLQEAPKQRMDESPKIKLTILLLQPLADPAVFAQCRNPLSRHPVSENGRNLATVTNDEYLDLSALATLWREAWKLLPPSAVDEVCFDLVMPRADGEVPWVYWVNDVPSEGGIGVLTPECTNLVQTLATTLKVRKGGEGVRYSLRNGMSEVDEEGRSLRGKGGLSRILERLTEYSGGPSRRR